MHWALWCVLAAAAGVAAAGCGGSLREPSSAPKSPGDNFYRLLINGDVERYTPGERYVVTLVGSRTHSVVQQFQRFQLVAAPQRPAAGGAGGGAGEFQLFADTLSSFDPLCPNAVVEADDLPKTEIQVMWKAPPAGSGCVLLKAMVLESPESWFAEDGQLTRRVCEDNSRRQDCCACDDAKYSLVFEGLWSAATHPKDFPTQALWLTHFSDLIGATHAPDFSFWGEGQLATDGFRTLAEWGSVGLLDRELRQRGAGGGVRGVVRAPGLWHPRVNTNTTAKFSVDRRRHRLSIASMFGPSPDWVVGVNGLELCRADCSWEPELVVDLTPYDAGTDNGVTYMSPNSETNPREKMYRITPMFPEDPRSPFYDPGASSIPPLARLYLTREAVVPRPCDQEVLLAQVTEEEASPNADKPECAVSPWSSWSPCSVSCGKGLRMRTRQYRMPSKAQMFQCERQLVSKEMCVADVPECEGGSAGPPEAEDPTLLRIDPTGGEGSAVCATSEWGPWSECSVSCGVGAATRRRYFLDRMGHKKCPLVDVEESRKCMEPACPEGEGETPETPDPQCPATPWSGWSPCSASCGRGVKFRTRLLLVPPEQQEPCSRKVELMQQRPCADRNDCTVDMPTAKRICMESPEVGPCRGLYQRWAFAAPKGMCVPFSYGGCRGNRNNFLTQQECLDTCSVVLGGGAPAPVAAAAAVVSTNYPGLSVSSIVPISNSVNGPAASNPLDCVAGPWGAWSRCSVSCGSGYQQRDRALIRSAGPGGAPCPARLSRRRRCFRAC